MLNAVLTRALHWTLYWVRWIHTILSHSVSLRYVLILNSHVLLDMPNSLFPSTFHNFLLLFHILILLLLRAFLFRSPLPSFYYFPQLCFRELKRIHRKFTLNTKDRFVQSTRYKDKLLYHISLQRYWIIKPKRPGLLRAVRIVLLELQTDKHMKPSCLPSESAIMLFNFSIWKHLALNLFCTKHINDL
jgi:hypothetical protein